jgi:hypothetical protein
MHEQYRKRIDQRRAPAPPPSRRHDTFRALLFALILSGGAFSFLYSVFYDRDQLASVPRIEEAPK